MEEVYDFDEEPQDVHRNFLIESKLVDESFDFESIREGCEVHEIQSRMEVEDIIRNNEFDMRISDQSETVKVYYRVYGPTNRACIILRETTAYVEGPDAYIVAKKLCSVMSLILSTGQELESVEQLYDVVGIEAHHVQEDRSLMPFRGIWSDVKKRFPRYFSDWKDGFVGKRHLQKTISAAFYLFFAILLPSIALGQVFARGTDGELQIIHVVWIQFVGGVAFSVLGGQPMVIIMTTAPMALFARVLYGVSLNLQLPFLAVYGWTGIFCAIFLLLFSILNLSWLVQSLSDFTKETFGMFIATAFLYTSLKALGDYFQYDASSFLYLLLLFFTCIIGLWIRKVRETLFFPANIRILISDFALPMAVILTSFFGSFIFRDVPIPVFDTNSQRIWASSPLFSISVGYVFMCLGFGIVLFILFVIDHSVSSAQAQGSNMKLSKGTAYNYDLFVTAFIVLISSVFGFPWITAATPHCALHVYSLADLDSAGQIIKARETRVAVFLANGMIGLALFTIPIPLTYIPVPVLYGTLLYMAATSIDGNIFFYRTLLYFTMRKNFNGLGFPVRRKTVYAYTAWQLVAWACLCAVAFVPEDYVNLCFPVMLIVLTATRLFLLPCFFRKKDLDKLDPLELDFTRR